MTDKRSRPRWIQRLIANWRGNFWLPCPICGQPFGGHEPGQGTLYATPHAGMSVCSNCVEEAARRNVEAFGWVGHG